MSEFYGRDGKPMTLMEWAEAFERGPDARRVVELVRLELAATS